MPSQTHTLFHTKMVKICTVFQAKTSQKPYPLMAAYTYVAHVREYPLAL